MVGWGAILVARALVIGRMDLSDSASDRAPARWRPGLPDGRRLTVPEGSTMRLLAAAALIVPVAAGRIMSRAVSAAGT